MAKSPYEIDGSASFLDAAHCAIRHQFDVMMENLPGTRAGHDNEALHDMRVASRRLRAALSVFQQAFPRKPFQHLERQVADVTDALGTVRDADVQIEFLEQKRAQAAEHEQVGVGALIDHLTDQRDKDRKVLVKALDKLSHSAITRDLERLLHG